MTVKTVVPAFKPVAELEFHELVVAGLNRAARKIGRGALADKLDMTPKGLGKIFAGSTPHAKRLFDALAVDPAALDDIADRYGVRLVPKGSICDTDEKAAPSLVAALHKVIEGESDGQIDHQELLGMERELIEAERTVQRLRARIADIRRPTAVA